MNQIKFSHDYEKLPLNWEGSQATLLEIKSYTIAYLMKICPKFLEYDTKIRGKDEHYKFTFDDALILFFVHNDTGLPFTTIRRFYGTKFDYYMDQRGHPFLMIKTEGEKK